MIQNFDSCLKCLALCAIFALAVGCSDDEKASENGLFRKLDASHSGITFRNDLTFDRAFNIYTYRNFYNGGGVAIGDINNDGLADVFLTSNMNDNKLYLNLGNFKFKDITDSAGVAGKQGWSTGVTMADVNGDGFLDIYVCNSGSRKDDIKQNELFINNGNGVFTEMAQAYGLADRGYSTHAAFFDYDNDGDLDMYLLNNSFQAIGSFNLMQNVRDQRDVAGGDKLFRNDDGKFVDVSSEAGIYGSVIGFGLGVTVGDGNNAGWLDIYISNDFFERDYLYLNNRNGTFSEMLTEGFASISAASMGADMADVNNDGLLDIFVTDMLPEQDSRFKQITTFENWDKIQYNVKHGYHYQYNRNMLHINQGNGKFVEVGRLCNVEATDWSWGALMFDMDNDGYKDIFVANGIYQDITDLDYLSFIVNENTIKKIISERGVDYEALITPIPINRVSNYAFKNLGDLKFKNVAREWGLSELVHSNGAAYGDLDNNGTLDLIINNVNEQAFVYQNVGIDTTNGYVRFVLKGEGKNTFGIGTRITIWAGDDTFSFEQMPSRGFQSTMEPVIHAGVGHHASLDSVRVSWPGGKSHVLHNVKVNQTITLRQEDAKYHKNGSRSEPKLLEDITDKVVAGIVHEENDFVDFDRDRLIYHMLSTQGPKVATGDVNGDGLMDFYLCGAKGSAGKLVLQNKDGRFIEKDVPKFDADKRHEDVDAVFFDADNDGDLDLFVASGGNEFTVNAIELRDRLYLNDGEGNFERADRTALTMREISSVVRVADFDNDGDIDIFLGSRAIPFSYGMPPSSYILINDGKGNFDDVTSRIAPDLAGIGMVTDATWTDFDGDGDLDLIVVGEWMHVVVLENRDNSFVDISNAAGTTDLKGWWNCIVKADIDGDGDDDYVVGNHGQNSRFKATAEQPVYAFVNDFDGNGSIEHVFARTIGRDIYPYTLRHDLVAQLPHLKKKYLKYSQYNDQRVNDIFSEDLLAKSLRLEAREMRSGLLINEGGKLRFQSLPVEAQLAPIFSFLVDDLDGDGVKDIIGGGNFFEAKPEAGRYDASRGVVLKGQKEGGFNVVGAEKSGLYEESALRDLKIIPWKGKRILLVAANNGPLKAYLIRSDD